jgi:hypothetical protein
MLSYTAKAHRGFKTLAPKGEPLKSPVWQVHLCGVDTITLLTLLHEGFFYFFGSAVATALGQRLQCATVRVSKGYDGSSLASHNGVFQKIGS